jgi:flavin-binding protein dodecin
MSEKVFKSIRVVGCSEKGYQEAIEAAVKKATETLHNLSWFEVVEYRGAIKDGNVVEWQATVDVAFKVE